MAVAVQTNRVMTEQMIITVEPVRMLTSVAELELLRTAVRQKSDTATTRLRFARLLNKMDLFTESINLLTDSTATNDDFRAKRALLMAYFGRNADGDNAAAKQIAKSALALVTTDTDRSYFLAECAKACLRLGEGEQAIVSLSSALALDPTNVNAFKRLALELLHRQQPQQVISLINDLEQGGIVHSRLLAIKMLALAALDRPESAAAVLGSEFSFHSAEIGHPPEWPDLAAFNAALAAEIWNNEGRRFDRYGTSSERSWRVDHPATGNTPAVTALTAEIMRIATLHAASSSEHGHAWSAARPANAVLRSWCVMTDGDGYEKWHMHPQGWMSGGYYVEVPDAVANGDDDAGCLMFGLPGGLIGEPAAEKIERQVIRPTPGLLTLFPSHAYHRTFPHNGKGRRMCIAFDICPA
jgi:tetratricopeptide (TPR) repeat protein